MMTIRRFCKYTIATLLLPAATMFSSCDEEYLVFDVNKPGIYFTRDTLEYSFSVTPIEVKRYTFNVPVKIMANVSDKARPIGVVVDQDSTTAVEGTHYELGEAVILPDSINGYIPITFLRENLEGTYATGYTRYKICLRLVDNGYFAPTLDSLSQVRMVRFDNAIDQPAWYTAHGDKKWPSELGSWHPYTFIKVVELFHELENILPETYYNMVAEYGENLEHVPYGNFKLYDVTMKKYIYYPLYLFINDPANRDMIRNEYRDYPFDVPNPYEIDDDPIN